MTEQTTLRQYLERYGMTVAWLTDDGHARIGGKPSNPYFEPFPSALRRIEANRISIFDTICSNGNIRLVFHRSLLHDVRPLRVTAEGFVRRPFANTLLLIGIGIAKLMGQFPEIQAKSEFAISIEQHNTRTPEEFPFDVPLWSRGASDDGVFYVQVPDEASWRRPPAWGMDLRILSSVNLIEVVSSQ